MNSNSNQDRFNYNMTEQERKVCDSSYLEVVLYYCAYPMQFLRSRYSFLVVVLYYCVYPMEILSSMQNSFLLGVVLYYCNYPNEFLRFIRLYSFLEWVLIIMFIIAVILFFQTLNYIISKIP